MGGSKAFLLECEEAGKWILQRFRATDVACIERIRQSYGQKSWLGDSSSLSDMKFSDLYLWESNGFCDVRSISNVNKNLIVWELIMIDTR